ncbi:MULTISPECIES: BON domain-containing protein [Legionella]|uniref:Hemolysin, lipoprotein n=1 Tax=Legionella drozanskii LLAP-1 TaxID=1212489 RepID=A0A0W0SMT0_9GAMM|nr:MULTISPECIES: BON domain-containing protein [Legionella]KTC84714.1 hemolysin, lipoprotein [Legionella drozanskii LLAP-1]PJE07469.1 MAG: BON domain-containing protein [Legionella sp.]
MRKQGRTIILLLSFALLGGCYSELWTGATMVYDRHNVYKKIDDYQLGAEAGHALYDDQLFKQQGCSIDLAVFNGDILLAGHLPTVKLRQEAIRRISALKGYRRVINQLDISKQPSSTIEDSWITTKIRSQIFADADIDPRVFKIITSDHIVYLMGDVKPRQALRVIDIARNTEGVERVVKLFKYYHLSQHALADT